MLSRCIIGLAMAIVLCAIIKVYEVVSKKKITIWKYLLAAYLCMLFAVTLFTESFGGGIDKFKGYQLVPFKTIGTQLANGNYFQLAGNLILLAPMVFLLYKCFKKLSLAAVVVISAVTSVGIELLQFAEVKWIGAYDRGLDVDDLILNILGIIIMAVFVCLFGRKKETA